MRFGGTHGNDPDVFATPRVDNYEHTTSRTHSERDKSLLLGIGIIIRDRDRIRIVKTGIASGIRTPCLRKLTPALLASSHSKLTNSVYVYFVHTSMPAPRNVQKPDLIDKA